jgi:hypothetical protein
MSFRTRSALRTYGVAALFLGLLTAVWLQGCKEGQAPYEVIPRDGDATDYLPPPPAGIQVGTTRSEPGLLYNFDRLLYQLLPPLGGTDPRFIRGDSVLVIRGANVEQRLRPDLSDATLAQVYANPRLFGFIGVAASQVGFVEGPAVPRAHEFFPHQAGDWWEQIHNNREWVRLDSILGVVTAPTGAGRTLYRVNHHSTARADLAFLYFRPPVFDAVVDFSADPSLGVAYHAWTLVAERTVHPDLRGGPRNEPSRHRNPLFLWPALGTLGTPDPQAPVPATVDQCLDGLPGFLERYPLIVSDQDFKVGSIFTTWTYLSVDPAELRQRLNTEPPRGRCGAEIVIGRDTLRAFPTRTFSLLCKFEVRIERAYETFALLRGGAGSDTLGVYRSDQPGLGVVKITVAMSIASVGGLESPAQYMELFVVRNLGEVVRRTGISPLTRLTTRLRQANVGGRFYSPAELRYRD